MSKYRSVRTSVDGISFASKREAKRYSELRLAQIAGMIANLVLQPRFPLIVNGKKICTMVADFSYFEKGKKVVEDSKGFRTREFINKSKLFRALHPDIDFREV